VVHGSPAATPASGQGQPSGSPSGSRFIRCPCCHWQWQCLPLARPSSSDDSVAAPTCRLSIYQSDRSATVPTSSCQCVCRTRDVAGQGRGRPESSVQSGPSNSTKPPPTHLIRPKDLRSIGWFSSRMSTFIQPTRVQFSVLRPRIDKRIDHSALAAKGKTRSDCTDCIYAKKYAIPRRSAVALALQNYSSTAVTAAHRALSR
jgi:hypothetical protein